MSKNNKVYLYYRHPKSSVKHQIYKVAQSLDGQNFEFFKTYKTGSYRTPTIPATYRKLVLSRPGYFDSHPIIIESVIKLSSRIFVYYHVCPNPGVYQVGYALFDINKNLLDRPTIPIWESPSTWAGKIVTFIGLVRFQDSFISYWDLGHHQIFSVVYPTFKFRQSVFSTITPTLSRIDNNPIISPNPKNNWESGQTFNPAVVLVDDKFHFLYRAIGDDGVSRFGYAFSQDGQSITGRLSHPVFTHETNGQKPRKYGQYPSGGSWSGAEDPRLVRVGNDDTLYMTYTACQDGLKIGFSSIRIDDFINGRWNWQPPIIISPPGEVHKNWVIFPEKIHGQYAILHAITPNIMVEYFDDLQFTGDKKITSSTDPQKIPPQNNCWDKRLRGAGSPPIKTDYGWLMFYHSMNYQVGVMLLDLDDPTKILYRAKAPVLESRADYEFNGFKPGIVYVSGAVVKDGTLYVYYGGADSYVCVATANLDQFLSELKQQPPFVLESTIINKII
jgi:beta-1,2-mannobiose phosphorylase / 1,2-beta-oligomannan phosphorylase